MQNRIHPLHGALHRRRIGHIAKARLDVTVRRPSSGLSSDSVRT